MNFIKASANINSCSLEYQCHFKNIQLPQYQLSQYQLSHYQLSQYQLSQCQLSQYSSLQVSYTGTKSYNRTFRDTGSQSVSGQMVVLTNLTSDTNYSIVVTSTNTAGFRNSSDAVVGTTQTGRKLPPSTFPSLHVSSSTMLHHESLHPTYSPSHLFTITPTHTSPFHISSSLLLPQMTVFPPFLSLSTSTTSSRCCSPNFNNNRTPNLHTHNCTCFQRGWTSQVRVNFISLV